MKEITSLLRAAKDSADGEVYVSVAAGPGFRIGIGARMGPGQKPGLFVEAVLDPFPERPHVSTRYLADQSDVVAWLEARGYAVACDDDSTIMCERSVSLDRATEEVRILRRRLEPGEPVRRTRHAARPKR